MHKKLLKTSFILVLAITLTACSTRIPKDKNVTNDKMEEVSDYTDLITNAVFSINNTGGYVESTRITPIKTGFLTSMLISLKQAIDSIDDKGGFVVTEKSTLIDAINCKVQFINTLSTTILTEYNKPCKADRYIHSFKRIWIPQLGKFSLRFIYIFKDGKKRFLDIPFTIY